MRQPTKQGECGHGRCAPTLTKKLKCPGYGKTCGMCGCSNHLEVVCQQKGKPPNQQLSGAENAISTSTCMTCQPSQTQPFLTLKVTTCPEDYQTLGPPKPTFTHKSIWASIMADTGCQSWLPRTKSVCLLSIHARDLIPVTMKMYTACNDGIKILGATILHLSDIPPSGGLP